MDKIGSLDHITGIIPRKAKPDIEKKNAKDQGKDER
jgi:hypothetical protein